MIELRDAGDLVEYLPPCPGCHVDELRDVTLHDDVVPLWGDSGRREQVLDVTEVHRATVYVVVGVVVLLGFLHPAFDRDLVDIADRLRSGGGDNLTAREGPVAVVEHHLDTRLPVTLERLTLLVTRVVDEVGQFLGPDTGGAG